MTVIAALVQDNIIYMGGDSASVGNYDINVMSTPKVFINGPFLIGFAGSWRFGQLLQYNFQPPRPSWIGDNDPMRFMVTKVVPALRECFKDGGLAQTVEGQEFGGRCLIGYAGHLYYFESDYHVNEPLDGFIAVGIGAQIAHGAMFASSQVPNPWKRVRTALEASERFNGGVRGPFTLLALDGDTHLEEKNDERQYGDVALREVVECGAATPGLRVRP